MSESYEFLTPTEIADNEIAATSDDELTDEEMRQWMNDVTRKIDNLIDHSINHTAAVNQFGQMLDYVVKSVAGFGDAIQKQGLMGLMKSAMGGK